MRTQNRNLLNQLQQLLPESLLADTQWFERMGYANSLRRRYVARGWLERVARGVFRRPIRLPGLPGVDVPLDWRQVVVSLQMVMDYPLAIGGRSALELGGYGHFVGLGDMREIHLYGDEAPPGWVRTLPMSTKIVFHNAGRLFPRGAVSKSLRILRDTVSKDIAADPSPLSGGLAWRRLGDGRWPIVLSTPERGALELLDELPQRETFEQADMIFEGLFNLRPGRMSDLLKACQSIKAKRLFLWFAERHGHAWFPQLDLQGVRLGSGKRMLAKGGRLDHSYGITVPAELTADG